MRRNLFYAIILGFLILGISLTIRDCYEIKKEKPVPVIEYVYETDTVYVPEPYSKEEEKGKKPIKDEKTTPPSTIKQYVDEPDNDKEIVITDKEEDILLVDKSTYDTTKINYKYITSFVYADKLLSMNLTRDTLGITTLSTGGKITSKLYPIYLKQYSYRWYDNKLNHYSDPESNNQNNPSSRLEKNTFNQLYLNGGYDWLNQSPTLGIDYMINIYRFRISAGTEINLKDSDIRFNTRLGYRLL